MAFLLKPMQIKSLDLSNRLVMPPMATAKSSYDGKVTSEVLNYYDEKSKGGYIGLIIIEHSFISQEGKASLNQLSIANASDVEGLKKLVEIIKENDSRAVMQINHAGSAADKNITGKTPIGPSPIANPRKGGTPHELTKDEIKDIIKSFAASARRVKEAGFDGVEIHSAHGYLLNQFFSPLTNQRSDEYGGDIFNRIRIHLQIIEAVRVVVGEDYPIFLRLGASDFIEGGTTIEDSKVAAMEFVKAGIDILDISGGFCGYSVENLKGQGYFSPLTEAIKKVVSIPVILTGGITEAQAAERLLSEGKADLIGVGRAILKDSQWAKRETKKLK